MTRPDVEVMRDLLAKVKAATGPDRWIDAEVHTALFPDDAFGRAIQEATRLTAAGKHEEFVEVPGVRMRAGSWVGSARLPAVSASIDAAVAFSRRALLDRRIHLNISTGGTLSDDAAASVNRTSEEASAHMMRPEYGPDEGFEGYVMEGQLHSAASAPLAIVAATLATCIVLFAAKDAAHG